MIKIFFKSIVAGFLIAASAALYINCASYGSVGAILGSILFAAGLATIFLANLNLYTGMIGFASTITDFKNCGITLIGNFIGAASILLMPTASSIQWSARLSLSPFNLFIRAIFCGIIIYLAAKLFKQTTNIITTILLVALFILSGAEHSIADAAYFFNALTFDLKSFSYLILLIVGNGLGSLITNQILII